MKVLQNAGTYKLLTPAEVLKLLLKVVEEAGRTCYQSESGPITEETANKFLRKIIDSGHESVIEHSIISVKFISLSRGFTHEQVRHRIAAYSQESTRYVDYTQNRKRVNLDAIDLQIVLPPHRDADEQIELSNGTTMSPREMCAMYEMFYQGLRKAGWQAQDARQLLPIGLVSEIVVTANFREWRHIFAMRTHKSAHWEIRSIMGKLLEELKGIIPVVFEDFEKAGEDVNGVPYYKKIK